MRSCSRRSMKRSCCLNRCARPFPPKRRTTMERKAATEHWTTTAVQDAALYRAQLMSPLAKANNGKARVIAVLPVKNNARVLREPAYQVVLFCRSEERRVGKE